MTKIEEVQNQILNLMNEHNLAGSFILADKDASVFTTILDRDWNVFVEGEDQDGKRTLSIDSTNSKDEEEAKEKVTASVKMALSLNEDGRRVYGLTSFILANLKDQGITWEKDESKMQSES